MKRRHGLAGILGAVGASLLPFVPGVVGVAAKAVTMAYPWAAPLVAAGGALVANAAPSIFAPKPERVTKAPKVRVRA